MGTNQKEDQSTQSTAFRERVLDQYYRPSHPLTRGSLAALEQSSSVEPEGATNVQSKPDRQRKKHVKSTRAGGFTEEQLQSTQDAAWAKRNDEVEAGDSYSTIPLRKLDKQRAAWDKHHHGHQSYGSQPPPLTGAPMPSQAYYPPTSGFSGLQQPHHSYGSARSNSTLPTGLLPPSSSGTEVHFYPFPGGFGPPDSTPTHGEPHHVSKRCFHCAKESQWGAH